MDAPGDEPLGWKGPLVAGVGGLVLALGLLEGAARQRPMERVQKVDLTAGFVQLRDGVPTWRADGSTPVRLGEDCGEAPEVLLLGSSIFFGSGIADAESLRPQLAARLPGVCVRSLAQAAYTFDNQAAELEAHLAAHTPAVVVWEVWLNSPNRWSVVGEAAYNFGPQAQQPADLPSPLGLPPSLGTALMARSAAYEHLVVSLIQDRPGTMARREDAFIDTRLGASVEALRASGIPVLLTLMPELSRPFSDSVDRPPSFYTQVQIPGRLPAAQLDIAAALAARDVDVEEARVDTCCHLSATGTAHLADAIAEALGPFLDDLEEEPAP